MQGYTDHRAAPGKRADQHSHCLLSAHLLMAWFHGGSARLQRIDVAHSTVSQALPGVHADVGFRRCKNAAELAREEQQQRNRYFQYRYADDGSIVLEGRLPAEAGALLIKALAAALPEETSPESERFEGRDVSAETWAPRSPIGMSRADALGVIAESFLKHGIESLSGGDRHQIIVHVDADTLADGCEGRCEIEEGPSMAAETARRLACDSTVIALIENDQGKPLNVGRATRTISPALRRLLNARDKGCRFPGCTHTRFVDAHHIRHWADGGETKPSNLALLCRHHHRCVHEGGFQIQVLDEGALRFLRSDGRAVDSVGPGHTRPMGDWEYLPASNRERGLSIDARTATTRWAGESMDYGLAVEVLMQRVAKKREVTATLDATASGLPTAPEVESTRERPAWMDLSWKVSAETSEDDGVWLSSERARGMGHVQELVDQ